MCHLDYTMSEAGGVTNFVRQYTLASGGPYCDCGFACVSVDVGGYGIIWGDDLDLSCDELWEHGEQVATPFVGLLSFGDASELWGLEVRILPVAPNHENPNLFSIGEGFGFFVFFGNENSGSSLTAVCPKPYQKKDHITKLTTVKVP